MAKRNVQAKSKATSAARARPSKALPQNPACVNLQQLYNGCNQALAQLEQTKQTVNILKGNVIATAKTLGCTWAAQYS